MKIVLTIALAFILQASWALEINYKTELESDLQFVTEKKEEIKKELSKIIQYFGISTKTIINYEILPFWQNKEFKNCARIYGTKRIYAHSPQSFKNRKNEALALGINKFCMKRSYNDLFYTLIHEFVHQATYTSLSKAPRWIWEGVAVALSGQLQNTSMGKWSISKIEKRKEINACTSFKDLHPYMEAGIVFLLYEKKYKGFMKELINNQILNQQKVAKFIAKKKLPCILSANEVSGLL